MSIASNHRALNPRYAKTWGGGGGISYLFPLKMGGGGGGEFLICFPLKCIQNFSHPGKPDEILDLILGRIL